MSAIDEAVANAVAVYWSKGMRLSGDKTMNCRYKAESISIGRLALSPVTLPVWTMVFVLMLVPQQVNGQEHAGLIGIVPDSVPEGIGYVTDNNDELKLEGLPESLQEFSDELLANLKKICSDAPLNLEDQKQVLQEISAQIETLDTAATNPQYKDSIDILVCLRGKLMKRLMILQAVLVTLDENLSQEKLMRPELKKMLSALEAYEEDLLIKQDENSPLLQPDAVVREQIKTLSQITEENIEPLEEAIRISYFNFNIRTYVSEPFAESVFYECRRECGPVCDFILGAKVRGTQNTNSGIAIDFLPCSNAALFSINVAGKTTSNTKGVTSQATIYTYGRHKFAAQKKMRFNGDSFQAYRATVKVWPHNSVTGAHLNRRGLIAKLIGDKIAYNKAVEARPKSEAIAASRLRSKLLPKFNRETENTFGELNTELRKLEKRMARYALAPDDKLARTDTDELRTAYRLLGYDQLAADRPAKDFNSKTGITLHIHQSWVNNALAIEGYDFNDTETSFPDFNKKLTDKFRKAFKIKRKVEPAEDNGDRLIISDVDPLRVQFEQGRIYVILRAGLRREGRDDVIKLRRIEIPLELQLDDETFSLRISEQEGDKVRVKPLIDKKPINNRIMGSKIRSQFEERLSKDSYKRVFDFPVNDEGDKKILVRVDQVHFANGWMIVVLEEDES